MKLIRFLCALCLAPLSATAGPGVDGRTVHGLAAAFDAHFRATLTEENVPGGAYAVVHRGVPVRVGVAGTSDLRTGRPVDTDTVFRVGSVSKGFAATLAAILAEEGRFSWDEPITRYVPEFRFRGDPRAIRVRDVVGQSTGFIPHAYDNLLEAGRPIREIWRRFASLSPICAPGSCYTYQNSAFGLIEPVLEKTADASFPKLIERRIFRPLGMDDASAGFGGYWASGNRAVPHVERRQGSWRAVDVEPNYYSVNSAAGVNASILDMAEWANAALGHRPKVLPPAVLNQVMTPRVKTARELRRRHWRDFLTDAHYGLGWRIYELAGERLSYHAGWVRGFVAEIALSREHDLGLVILMNGESNAIGELGSQFWARALEAFHRPMVADTADSMARTSAP